MEVKRVMANLNGYDLCNIGEHKYTLVETKNNSAVISSWSIWNLIGFVEDGKIQKWENIA